MRIACYIPTPTCNATQDLVNNQCVTKCPTGQQRDTAGVCLTPTVTCNATQDLVNNQCVTKCPTGQSRNAAGACVITPPTCNATQDLVNNQCVTKCPTGQSRNAAGACVITPPACNTTQDLVNNQCVTKCPTGQSRNAAGICVTQTSQPPCALPKQLISGVCTLPPQPPMSCKDAEEHDSDDDNDDDRHKKSNSLKITEVAAQAVHADEMLNVGVAVYGDDARVKMGVNLPKGASFTESYNSDLHLKQGVLHWQVPGSLTNKTVKIKFCAKEQKYGRSTQFVSRSVLVNVLPKIAPAMKAHPVVAANAISDVVYNPMLKKLEISGQVKWVAKSTPATRKKTLVTPVNLRDAHTAKALGSAKVRANGTWSAVIASPSSTRAIDAIFQGRVGTGLVKK
jgi:hypothetical protein